MPLTPVELESFKKLITQTSQNRTDQLHFILVNLLEKSGQFKAAIQQLEKLHQHILNYQHKTGDSYHARYSQMVINNNLTKGRTDNLSQNLGFFLELLFSVKLHKDTVMPAIQEAYTKLLTSIQTKLQEQETKERMFTPIVVAAYSPETTYTTNDKVSNSEEHTTETSKQNQIISQRSPSPTYSEISDLTAETDNEAYNSSSSNNIKPRASNSQRTPSNNIAKKQQDLCNRLTKQPEHPWCKSSNDYASANRTFGRAGNSKFSLTDCKLINFAYINTQPDNSKPKHAAKHKY